MKLRTLHGTGLVITILAVTVLLTGVVYAGIRFAPDFIQLLNKRTNEQGHTEYTVPSYAQCQDTNTFKLDTFAVKPGANINDDEVRKIVQARCELEAINQFASTTWPTYGQSKEWRDGDTIYYTRPNIQGTVANIDKNKVSLVFGDQTWAYQTFENKDLIAYSHGKQIPAADIKPGDFVFVIERVAETYFANPMQRGSATKQDGATYITNYDQPKSLGAVAIVKMSQPKEYYRQKQSLIYEVQPCSGNPGETCPKEFQVGIDVFPRGSEGATNPHLRSRDSAVMREINGTVTTIGADAVTITSNKGNVFTLHLTKAEIDSFNTNTAPIHQENGRFPLDKVSIHPGSWLSVTYLQTPQDNPRDIQLEDIFKVYLQADIQIKG